MFSKIKVQMNTFACHRNLLMALGQTSAVLRRKIPGFVTIEKAVETLRRDRLTLFYSKLVSQGDLCFDVGAYVGEYTGVLSGLGAKVVACEPQPREAARLCGLFRNNNNVVVVSKAVGDKEGEADLHISEKTGGVSTLSANYKSSPELREYEWTRTAKVRVTTLDRLIELYGKPGYCKIDVEGFEVQVLKGLSVPIELLSFEFHKWLLGEARTCIELLQGLGKYRFNLMLGNSMKFMFADWVEPEVLNGGICQGWNGLDKHARFVWGDIYCKLVE